MKSDLDRAQVLYKRKKYARVIRLLEPQVFQYRESFRFYYLLGMCCIKTGDTGGAQTYLDRALGLKPNNVEAIAGLAFVYLKRYDITKAIQCYLDIVDEEPGNRIARKALKSLRNNAERERLIPLVDSGRLDSLLPIQRSYFGLVVGASAIVAAGAIFLFGYLIVTRVNDTPPREPQVAELTLSWIDSLSIPSDDSTYTLTDREIERIFGDAKRYFADFRDNLALREINRILLSNASEAVKTQARTIAEFIDAPDFTNIADPFSYDTVADDPLLYAGTYVTWKGRTSNVVIGTDAIVFDLLVGYDTYEVLEGVVPVVFKTAVDIANGRPVEILGKVVPTENGVTLLGISLHRLADK